jgi:hypothetical protein
VRRRRTLRSRRVEVALWRVEGEATADTLGVCIESTRSEVLKRETWSVSQRWETRSPGVRVELVANLLLEWTNKLIVRFITVSLWRLLQGRRNSESKSVISVKRTNGSRNHEMLQKSTRFVGLLRGGLQK